MTRLLKMIRILWGVLILTSLFPVVSHANDPNPDEVKKEEQVAEKKKSFKERLDALAKHPPYSGARLFDAD